MPGTGKVKIPTSFLPLCPATAAEPGGAPLPHHQAKRSFATGPPNLAPFGCLEILGPAFFGPPTRRWASETEMGSAVELITQAVNLVVPGGDNIFLGQLGPSPGDQVERGARHKGEIFILVVAEHIDRCLLPVLGAGPGPGTRRRSSRSVGTGLTTTPACDHECGPGSTPSSRTEALSP